MPLKSLYVTARSASGRPTLQHRLVDGQTDWMACGRRIDDWSRAYTPRKIEEVLCLRHACRA